jgi:DNA-binding LacI/PurR family transcriptional regulator
MTQVVTPVSTSAVTASLELELPLPEKEAAVALRRQIIRHLRQRRPERGTPLMSEQQLMNLTGLSRSTVRRTLMPLERSGWIERRQGVGTFVGPRATTFREDRLDEEPAVPARRLLRLTIVTERPPVFVPNPYLDGVLRGVETVANHDDVSVELVSLTADSLDAFSRRVQRSRPDVIAVVGSRATMGFVKGAATLLRIPAIGTGDSAVEVGLPAVSYEDDRGAQQAAEFLLSQGHRRIALVQQESTNPYVLRRRQGFWKAMQAAGLGRDQNLELWLPSWNASQDRAPAEQVELLKAFLAEQKPTAVLLGEGKIISLLGVLKQAGVVRIPADLSVITFDRNDAEYAAWLGDIHPTVVALPLEQAGRRLCEIARAVLQGQPPRQPVREPCQIISGNSVRSLL